MKHSLIFVFAFVSMFAGAQHKRTLPPNVYYYTSRWELTSPEYMDSYKRIAKYDTVLNFFDGPVIDLRLHKGIMADTVMTGGYKRKWKDGKFVFYHETGGVESVGMYTSDRRTGLWKYYYRLGQLKQEIEFIPGADPKVLNYYKPDGTKLVEDGTGTWSHTFDDPWYGETTVTGQFKNYLKVGTWTTKNWKYTTITEYDDNGKLLSGRPVEQNGEIIGTSYGQYYTFFESNKFAHTEEFKTVLDNPFSHYPELKMVTGDMVRILPNPLRRYKEEPILSSVDDEPVPTIGNAGLQKLIKENLRYPAEAKAASVQGRIVMDFIVEKDGTISDIRVIENLGSGCDDEAVRLLTKYGSNWIPAKNKGKVVRCRWAWAVNFQL